MDVYVDRRGRVWLMDFNVFGAPTDPLLFPWPHLTAPPPELEGEGEGEDEGVWAVEIEGEGEGDEGFEVCAISGMALSGLSGLLWEWSPPV
jgi:hypothetical protein